MFPHYDRDGARTSLLPLINQSVNQTIRQFSEDQSGSDQTLDVNFSPRAKI